MTHAEAERIKEAVTRRLLQPTSSAQVEIE